MSTQHIVHRIIEPGLPGDGFTEPEASFVRAAVDRVDPGAAAPFVGASLRQGPTGPDWAKDAVSADWYSNPNDAFVAAGVGGRVHFSGATTYEISEPLRILPSQIVTGDNSRDTLIQASGAGTIIEVHDPSQNHRNVTIRGLALRGDGQTEVGLDARGMSRSQYTDIRILNIADAGVLLGGDMPAYGDGWSNFLDKIEINAPENGAGIRADGYTGGGTGARTSNNHEISNSIINIGSAATSIGIDIVAADAILVRHCDVGYSISGGAGDGIPFMLRYGARGNTIAFNRTEMVWRDVVIEGGLENTIIGNWFTSYHDTYYPVEVRQGGRPLGSFHLLPNQFIGNSYSNQARQPYVWEDGDLRSFVVEMGVFRGASTGGQVPLTVTGSNGPWYVTGGASMFWPAPSSGSFSQAQLLYESGSTGALRWADGSLVKLPKVASLPSATASRRGAVLRVEGGAGVADKTYECRKQANDTYAWVEI